MQFLRILFNRFSLLSSCLAVLNVCVCALSAFLKCLFVAYTHPHPHNVEEDEEEEGTTNRHCVKAARLYLASSGTYQED